MKIFIFCILTIMSICIVLMLLALLIWAIRIIFKMIKYFFSEGILVGITGTAVTILLVCMFILYIISECVKVGG